MTKHLIIGLGLVGKSFLRILKEQGHFCSESFFCLDKDPDALCIFTDLGGAKDHFSCLKMTKENYKDILQPYTDGDYVFDFSCEVRNLDLLQYALTHNLHYLSTADSHWDMEDPAWVSAHQHFVEYQKLARKKNKNAYTSIIEFGMNPGLVSCFAKQCLKKIVETDTSDYITKNREKLMRMLQAKSFAKVARKIGVEYIVEVDHDDQKFNIQQEEGVVYSPWNPLSYHHESLSAPEIIFGTWKQFRQFDRVRDCDFLDYYVSLLRQGIDCKEEVFSPQGAVVGSLLTHEEIYSMSYYFKRHRHKPTAFFVYKPCSLAEKSIEDNRNAGSVCYKVLDIDAWSSGGESVGIILQGKRFHSAYFGNYLGSEGLEETATIVQVGAAAFSAYIYMVNHPRSGFLFPEDIEEEEVLESAKNYLKNYIFQKCPPVHPHFGKKEQVKHG